MLRLVLASQSPRRSELLTRAGFLFSVTSPQISEIPDENLNLQDQIKDLAYQKAMACLEAGKVLKGQGNLVLSADTVVVLDGEILGKPKDVQENKHYLSRLSARTHQVITAVCLVEADTGRFVTDCDTALVTFASLSDTEMDQYVATHEGLDKAGGYGVQGGASRFVAKIDGAFDTVMGLPVALVERLLLEQGWWVERSQRS